MQYIPNQTCYSGWENTLAQKMPTKQQVQQLASKYPNLSSQIASLAQRILNGSLTVQQALISVDAITSKIPVPTVGAGLKGAACILNAATTRSSTEQQVALQLAGNLVQLAANFLATIKDKNKPSQY